MKPLRSVYSEWDESEIRRQLPAGELCDQIVSLVAELQSARGKVSPQLLLARKVCATLREEYSVDLRAAQWDEAERMIARFATDMVSK
jgi:hypothetical protein